MSGLIRHLAALCLSEECGVGYSSNQREYSKHLQNAQGVLVKLHRFKLGVQTIIFAATDQTRVPPHS